MGSGGGHTIGNSQKNGGGRGHIQNMSRRGNISSKGIYISPRNIAGGRRGGCVINRGGGEFSDLSGSEGRILKKNCFCRQGKNKMSNRVDY